MEPQKPNTVLIGKKPTINYVMAILKLFNDEGVEEVIVKARGRNVCKAIDAVEMLRNMFIKDVDINDIKIYSEELLDESAATKKKITAIEVVLRKPRT